MGIPDALLLRGSVIRMAGLGQVLTSRPPDRMSAAEGEAAETAGKRT